MKKQILYSMLAPRLFSTAVDFGLLSLLSSPLIHFAGRRLGLSFLGRMLRFEDLVSLDPIVSSRVFWYAATLIGLNILCTAIYFIGFWRYVGATPGKMLMRLKVVKIEDHTQPSTAQLVRRFLFAITALFGIWMVLVTKHKQALHDKLAGTVVIKA